jgi:hypothetical protein
MRVEYTLATNADDETPEFPLKAGSFLTIHHEASGGSPTGTWTLEVFNEAAGEWQEITDASTEFENPAGSQASGVANYSNPNQGRGRVAYARASGGQASGAIVVVYQESARN